jgi:hypothetical protein
MGLEIGLSTTGFGMGSGLGFGSIGGGEDTIGSTSTGSTRVISSGSSRSTRGCHQWLIPAINPKCRIADPPKPMARIVFNCWFDLDRCRFSRLDCCIWLKSCVDLSIVGVAVAVRASSKASKKFANNLQ